ncbi:hypothetical protein KCV06_g199, partial [Aureobasidium melanogenum]
MTRTSARRGSQRSMFSGLRSQWIILLDCSRHKQASIWRAKRRMSWSENPEKFLIRILLMDQHNVVEYRCLLMESLLIANDLDSTQSAELVVDAPHYLSETSFTKHINHLVAVS